MSEIKINTEYAKRDISRMNAAIEDLNDAEKLYNKLISDLNAMYKGDASNELQDIIRSIKIKNINLMRENLRDARDKLQTTVEKYEAADENLKKTMGVNGSGKAN